MKQFKKISIFPHGKRIIDEDDIVYEGADLEIVLYKIGSFLKIITYEWFIKSEFNIIRIEVFKT